MQKARVASVVLSAVFALGASATERSSAIRVFVRAGGGGAHGAADSVADVQAILANQKPDSVLTLAQDSSGADLVLEITGRHTTKKMDYGLTPPAEVVFSVVQGAILDDGRSRPVEGETSVIIKSWREAAAHLVSALASYAADEQHVLLRRREDWPAVGFEFEELTKALKKQYGAKDGKVVVTAVQPGSPAEQAGIQVGDAVLTLDGQKLKNPGTLARTLYTRAGSGSVSLGVAQRGSGRTLSLTVP